MKMLFDDFSFGASKMVTETYSTSFSSAVKMLSPTIRQDIYNIYGFVRLADEIVDSFQEYNQSELFYRFKQDLQLAMQENISINPVLNAFQHTVHKYAIAPELINAFLSSMENDLTKKNYQTTQEYNNYIYGSADVVGLMCLCVFVNGDMAKFERLKQYAMHLGSAFQKVNFLRDIKYDSDYLNRSYFPTVELATLTDRDKGIIIAEIEEDLRLGYLGILELPFEAKLGVYVAYAYYKKLLMKLKNTQATTIVQSRIRVSNFQKLQLFAKCYFDYKLRMI